MQRFFALTGELPTAQLTAGQWNALNLVWASFFAVLGGLNLYVAFSFSEAAWINFKVFGLTGLTLVFIIVQGIWILPKLRDDKTAGPDGS